MVERFPFLRLLKVQNQYFSDTWALIEFRGMKLLGINRPVEQIEISKQHDPPDHAVAHSWRC